MSGDHFTPDEALREIGRMDRQVRRSTRGPGRAYLLVGLATMVYWPVMLLGGGVWPLIGGLGWVVLTITLCVYWARLRVHDRLLQRVRKPVEAAYVVTMALPFVYDVWLMPPRPTAGSTVALLALSVLAGLPLVYGASLLIRDSPAEAPLTRDR
ncbi:hypothetical protein F5972_26405 [Microbispora cellulosiformans]|uniref:Uncharacterized protein n=1 Tax=Microbispora cellulosiformans TaxID=2614688 RepID=A0A5J5JWN0_9ACTN|nr:hypothetical protein [Microbispora cellulosiformans]KAA9375728.1 hypothetical protein F5972_26405 [Microbispora cellulosiformans]